MRNQHNDFDDTWANLIPEQPQDRSRWMTWAAIVGGIMVILCICAASGYLLVTEVLATPESVASPIIPTDPLATAEEQSDEQAQSTPTLSPTESVELAPTATTIPEATTPIELTAAPPVPVGSIEAFLVTTPPVVDGILSEWPDSQRTISQFRVFSAEGWDGSDDLVAAWRLAWDANNLYVAVEVTDDVHVQTQSGNQIFRGDSLDIQFDTDRLGDFGDSLSQDDFQITLSPGDFASLPESAFRFQGTATGLIIDAPGGNQVTVEAQQTGGGYTLEAAIPWSDLAMTPSAEMVIGLALNANDNDTPSTGVQEVMMSHVASRTLTDPSGWGTLVLRP